MEHADLVATVLSLVYRAPGGAGVPPQPPRGFAQGVGALLEAVDVVGFIATCQRTSAKGHWASLSHRFPVELWEPVASQIAALPRAASPPASPPLSRVPVPPRAPPPPPPLEMAMDDDEADQFSEAV